jgi:acyl carrier protein
MADMDSADMDIADMDINDAVRQVIAKTLKVPPEELKDDTLLGDLGAESLDVIEIVYELEEKFGITISFKDDEGSYLVVAEKDGVKSDEMEFRTVGEIAQVVRRFVDAKAS